jgi:type I restriction enzyme, S subunit
MELRPGYKRTELGVVPEDWCIRSLGECVRSEAPICYGILMPGQHCHGGVPVIKVKDVLEGQIDESDLLLTNPSIDNAYKRSRLAGGDVLITIRGTTGRVALVPTSLNGANITQDTARLRARSSVDQQFLYHALQGSGSQQQVALHTIGQAVKGINIRDVKRVVIPFPPSLGEQQVIAEALSDVDALLGGLDRLIAKKRDLKQAAMQQLLTGQTRLPGFQGEWVVKPLGTDVTLLSGHHVLAEHCNTRGEGLPYLTGPADFPEGRIQQTKFTKLPGTICQTNDILVTVKGSGSGALVLADGAYCISRQLMAIRVSAWNHRFLFYSLQQNAARFKAASSGLIPGLSRSDILDQQLPVPRTSTEQSAVAAALADMDAELAALEQRREKTRALKLAMMQELLTGKTRLLTPQAAHA